jgi:hypothetical protein
MLLRDDAAIVTWFTRGPAPFQSGAIRVFINLDKMIGKDFEVGLGYFKRLMEK